ncbi:FtsX-like permease family protein [Spirosoma sp. HMF4905]|uniref:FtsX-like permease family protein n=1 Tax=Spirosoma arboris TaxID=2682092 RepID=A0A7K1SG70_9BACT|nr:ABC transporter permease [Spirosoma arboris]MVM32566.1 FtsX-like permease family protein [Spirosoma arboris]
MTPPRLANRLLEIFCNPLLLEEVQGDLYERFNRRVASVGLAEARRQFNKEVLGFLWPRSGQYWAGLPAAFRHQFDYPKPSFTLMFRNYLNISLRNLWRNRQVSAINTFGLAAGLACGIVIFLLVSYMFSFDRYHAKADRTFWVVTDIRHENVVPTDATPRPLADVLRREYPFVESAVRLENTFGRVVGIPNGKGGFAKKFEESRNICFTEPQFFDVFDVQWRSGNPKTALAAPNTVVLSERYAQKYFDTQNVIGRTIRFDNQTNLTVTGIIKNPPSNTKLRYDVLISYSTVPAMMGENGKQAMQNWEGIHAMCFVALREGTVPQRLADALVATGHKYLKTKDAKLLDFHALPLSDLNHNPQYGGTAPRPILYALIIVGLFLVIAACINFINIATAYALKRSKEVGVRKAMGSTRMQLIGQFLIETTLITLTAVLVAILFAQLALPLLNNALAILGTDLSVLDLLKPQSLLWFGALILGVILIAGFYPSLVLSRFNPVAALRGRLTTKQVGSVSVRRGLVVVQFFITQLFIIGLIVMMAQVRYMQKKDLGFYKDAVLTVPVPTDDPIRQQTLRDQLQTLPGVEQISLGAEPPTSRQRDPVSFTFDTHTQPEKFPTRAKIGDMNYVPLFGLKLLAGRNFSTNDTTNNEALVNGTMVKQLGLQSPGDVLGKQLTIWGQHRVIVGVVNDFNTDELYSTIPPTTLINYHPENNMAAIKLNPADLAETTKAVEARWNELFPEAVYKASFVDEMLDQFYLKERVLLGLIQVFSLIAILIGCLGLYALVSFMSEAKTKEIGIRKVMGATVNQVLWLFGKEFSKLMLIGFVLAAPLGWFLMRGWLNGYAYHIDFSWWVFALALGMIVVITLATVSYQSLKAAITNPAKSLRTE